MPFFPPWNIKGDSLQSVQAALFHIMKVKGKLGCWAPKMERKHHKSRPCESVYFIASLLKSNDCFVWRTVQNLDYYLLNVFPASHLSIHRVCVCVLCVCACVRACEREGNRVISQRSVILIIKKIVHKNISILVAGVLLLIIIVFFLLK